MAERPFNEPRLALNRIYTRRGDRGFTSLVGGQQVSKDTLRVECYGAVDELNAFLGLASNSTTEHPQLAELSFIFLRIQHELFNLGSILATLPEDVHPQQPQITSAEITRLEEEIDRFNETLPPLRSFVLPGGSRINAELHICRTICRRAERLLVRLSREETVSAESIQYLNRLSDAFFVWSRWASHTLQIEEILWQPNKSSSRVSGKEK